ncbi:hypothetical protein CTI12_AA601920 [Artemisia annua]|uniref:Uncharacterized protein n=1 Tax=Artemisia annua TaxID=35608 RepID=A0A2U1KBQ5_ARTAN|nr:hypothetical protein CTI12_AA601920 [Artemisia annua]
MYEVEKPEPSTARKRNASDGDGEGSSRKRRLIGEEDSSEDEEASIFLPEKEVVYPSAYAVAMRETKSPFVDASPQKDAEERVSRPPGYLFLAVDAGRTFLTSLKVIGSSCVIHYSYLECTLKPSIDLREVKHKLNWPTGLFGWAYFAKLLCRALGLSMTIRKPN